MDKPDQLDKLSAAAVTLLLIAVMVICVQNKELLPAGNSSAALQQAQMPSSPDLERKIELATQLLNNNNIEKAETLIHNLVAEFPYYGAPFMVLGDLHLRKQNTVQAMLAYKEAILLNIDYLDKKTPLFQGKKIKNTVNEAMALIEKQLRETPGDDILKQQKETAYFMMRKIAGSCG